MLSRYVGLDRSNTHHLRDHKLRGHSTTRPKHTSCRNPDTTHTSHHSSRHQGDRKGQEKRESCRGRSRNPPFSTPGHARKVAKRVLDPWGRSGGKRRTTNLWKVDRETQCVTAYHNNTQRFCRLCRRSCRHVGLFASWLLLVVCVGALTLPACACAFDGFLLKFLHVSASPLPRRLVINSVRNACDIPGEQILQYTILLSQSSVTFMWFALSSCPFRFNRNMRNRAIAAENEKGQKPRTIRRLLGVECVSVSLFGLLIG